MIIACANENNSPITIARFGLGTAGYTRVNLKIDGIEHIGLVIGSAPLAQDRIHIGLAFPNIELFDEIMTNFRKLLEVDAKKFPTISIGSAERPALSLEESQELVEAKEEIEETHLLDTEIRDVLIKAKQMLDDRHGFNGDGASFEQRMDILIQQLS